MGTSRAVCEALYHDAVTVSPGLPGVQHASLVHRQKMQCRYQRPKKDMRESPTSTYEAHTSTSVTYSVPRSACPRLNHEQHVHRSEMRHATRQAFALSINTPDGHCVVDKKCAGCRPPIRGCHWGHCDEGERIPQKYIDEFNQKWHEYDEDNDADQYIADMMANAPWRKHQPIRPMYTADGEFSLPHRKHQVDQEPRQRCDIDPADYSGLVEHDEADSLRPPLVSRFSIEQDDRENVSLPKRCPMAAVGKYGKPLVQCLKKRSKQSVNSKEKLCTKDRKTYCAACSCEMQSARKAAAKKCLVMCERTACS